MLHENIKDRHIIVGTELYPAEEADLKEFLRQNANVLAWTAHDLRGVDKNVIEHALNIDPKVKPKKEKLRKMSDDKVAAIESEVQRLLDTGVIREVQYPTWLVNTVPIKKKNGKWRMCIDFTSLNKACPKDDTHCSELTP